MGTSRSFCNGGAAVLFEVAVVTDLLALFTFLKKIRHGLRGAVPRHFHDVQMACRLRGR